MDMTPMIDVVFLLIIFFLCIDFKILEAKLPAYLPKDVGSQATKVEPQEKLRIQIMCTNWGTEKPRPSKTKLEKGKKRSYYLVDHRVEYFVGPKRVKTLDDVKEELERIAKDPSKKQKDPTTGELKYMGVVVEPRPQVVYGDVAPLVDCISSIKIPGTEEACFEDINFGGGLGSKGGGKK